MARPLLSAWIAAVTPAVCLLAFDPLHVTRFGVPKAALAWLGILMGLLLARGRIATPRLAPWLALVGWGALSLAWSPAPQRGLAQLACWALILPWCALLLSVFTTDPRWRTRYVLAGLIAGLLCAGLALAQRAGVGPRLGHHLVTGTLGNPNHLACVLLLLLPASRWLIRARRDRLRWLGWGAALALSAAIVATRCQGATVGMVAVWGYWIASCSWPRRRRIALLVCLVLAGAALWAHPGWRRSFAGGLTGRLHLARVTAGVIGDHPLRGTGLGGFPNAAVEVQGELLRDHRGPGLWTNLRDAHNQPLMLLAELGPVGLAALLWLVVPPLLSCHRRRKEDPLAAEAVAAWLGLLVCGLTETPLQAPLIVLLAFGWLVIGGRHTEQEKRRINPRSALLALAALGLVHAVSFLWADLQLGRGLRTASSITTRSTPAAQRQQLGEAIRAYGGGFSPLVDPSDLLLQRAIARRELGQDAAATRDMRRSYALLPTPERALFLGDLATTHGELDEALAWYRRAIALHPRYARAYNNLGVALLRRGDAREARRYLRRALSLRPYDAAIRANWRLVRRGPAADASAPEMPESELSSILGSMSRTRPQIEPQRRSSRWAFYALASATTLATLACSGTEAPPDGAVPPKDGASSEQRVDGPPADASHTDGSKQDTVAPDASKPKLKPFPLPATLDLKGETSSVAVADLDGDGYLDLVTLVVASGTAKLRDVSLVVAWGDAAGVYSGRYSHKVGQAYWTRDSSTAVVAIGDVNKDGRLDLATASGVASGGPKRSFTYKALPGASQLLQPALLVDKAKTGALTLYRGTRAGKVEQCAVGGSCASLPGQPETCPPATDCAIEDLVSGDFDKDGKPDIVGGGQPIVSPFTRFSRAWLSSKQYKSPVKITGMHAVDMEAGDVDGDGVTDVVAQQMEFISDFPSYTDVWIATPASAGLFKKIETIYNFDNHNDNAAVADMNGDGCLDLMMIGVDASAVGVRRGVKQGSGCSGFLGPHDPSKTVDAGGWKSTKGLAGTIGIQQLDVNGDGKPDWVIRTGFNAKPMLHFLSVPKLP